jgi:hypothetical protein
VITFSFHAIKSLQLTNLAIFRNMESAYIGKQNTEKHPCPIRILTGALSWTWTALAIQFEAIKVCIELTTTSRNPAVRNLSFACR